MEEVRQTKLRFEEVLGVPLLNEGLDLGWTWAKTLKAKARKCGAAHAGIRRDLPGMQFAGSLIIPKFNQP